LHFSFKSNIIQFCNRTIIIEGGTNLTFLHKSTTLFPSNPKFGFTGGVSLQYNFSGRFGFKTAINFERRITKVATKSTEFNVVSVDNRHHARFDYITIPLMARITWVDKGKFYYFNAGPHLGYLFRQVNDFNGDITDNTAVFNNFDVGLSLGVGSMFPINKNLYLTTEVRNNLGLRDMLNTDNSIKTNAVNLLAGIVYRL